jgi:hypothetical protein
MSDFEERLGRHVDESTPEQLPPFGEVVAARDRRRRRRRAVAASGTAMLAVAAIAVGTQLVGEDEGPVSGGVTTSGPTPTESGDPDLSYEWSNKPSPVVLLLDDGAVSLRPWAYCWSGPPDDSGSASGICADGYAETASLDDVGSPGSVDFWFGVSGWEFQATFTELGAKCPRQYTLDAQPTGDKTFRLDPAGPAGRYRVDFFGRGASDVEDGPDGDVAASFVWTTPVDGPIEQPAGYLALVTDDGPRYTSYGVELGISDLAFQPQEASAQVTVTSAQGKSATFQPPFEGRAQPDCSAEGSLFFADNDMDAVAAEVAALGEGPFDYRVELTIDGEEYVGTAVWPRDERKDEAPNTVLTFDPPLPAYAAD